MARKRMIDPEFWLDEKIASLSLGARLLFIGIWNFADDEGLIRFNSSFLKSTIFSYDKFDLEKIEAFMKELTDARLLFPYVGGITNQKYAHIPNFLKYQTINRPQPSKLPPPSIQNRKVYEMFLERDKNICHLCGGEIAEFGNSKLPGSLTGSLDHIRPRSNGGTDYPSNIKIAHLTCNKSRGNKPMNDSYTNSVNDSRLKEVKVIESKLNKLNKPLNINKTKDEIYKKMGWK